MVYHANSDWLPGGFLGVEMFFVISGYLITLLLISERERTYRISLRHFWLRRARRLLPALFTMMLLRHGLDGDLQERGARRTARRRDRRVLLRLELVPDLGGARIHRRRRLRAAAAPVEPGGRRAVLHLLAGRDDLPARPQRHPPGRRREPLAVRRGPAITVATALLFYPGPIAEPNVTPDAYWWIGDRPIAKIDTLYLGTISRLSGILLGAAFAMVWRPLAIVRGPLRSKGRLFDGLALVAIVAFGWLCWNTYLATPAGADPFLFRGGLFIAGLATLVDHRRSHPPRRLREPPARQSAVPVDRHPLVRPVPLPLADLSDDPRGGRQQAHRSSSSCCALFAHGDRHRSVVPADRDADPAGAGSPPVGARSSPGRRRGPKLAISGVVALGAVAGCSSEPSC